MDDGKLRALLTVECGSQQGGGPATHAVRHDAPGQ